MANSSIRGNHKLGIEKQTHESKNSDNQKRLGNPKQKKIQVRFVKTQYTNLKQV